MYRRSGGLLKTPQLPECVCVKPKTKSINYYIHISPAMTVSD